MTRERTTWNRSEIERNAAQLADHAAPAWVFLHGLKSPLSSTALRAARQSRKSH